MPGSPPAPQSSRGSPAGAPSRVPGLRGYWLRLSLSARWLFALGLLLVLVCLFFAEENWRGRRAWELCQQELKAKGVELDWQRFVPPPVPDDQNFAQTPFLAPLLDIVRQPGQPGPPVWREQDARERAVNFAAGLLPIDKQWQIPPARFEGKLTGLEGALLLLRKQTNRSSAAAPLFANRAEAAAALLGVLEEYQPVLDELRLASRRPHCRFNIEYDAQDPFRILLPHYLVLQRVCRVLELRASAQLALRRPEAAFEDVKLMQYMAGSTRGEPFLMGLAARSSLLKRTEQVIWEGLAGRHWTEPQLEELQTELKSFNLLQELQTGMQSERAAFGETAFRYIRSHKNVLRNWIASMDEPGSLLYLLAGPSGWLYQEQASYSRLFEERVLSGLKSADGRLHPRAIDANRKALEAELQRSALWHHIGFSRVMLRKISQTLPSTAFAQNRLNQSLLACALERYRLGHGQFPATLQSLTPQFLDRLPLDVCEGRPLSYHLLPDGRFVLYGLGWNETDDGGEAVMKPDGSDSDPYQGDWVWPPYPQP